MLNGIIPLFKERGMTSFDCVRKLRGILKMKKIGHSGTLDPNVDGVLPICLGNGTKVVDYLMNSGKIYRGSITLGFSTTTEDLDGEIVDQQALLKPLNDDQINTALNEFVQPELIQIPPIYSAVKVKGKRLYEYAREGLEVERPERKVRIDYFKQTKPSIYDADKQQQTIYFEVGCGKGTYVRTLAVDFGKKFGIPAVMSDLTRIKSGNFDIDKTVTLKEIESAAKNNDFSNIVYSIDHALINFKHIDLTHKQWKIVKNGGFLSSSVINQNDDYLVLTYENDIKALYYFDSTKNIYKPEKMFNVN
ncbi:tRNA pseudouridine(55) synthase TruB [Apilactobacillus sp. TMW 2.2459]|uniref:tRNA pseudouridine(55) synthase TruB n=1 Tax=Apilactobacillus xinyiensis TaxID=2841032 RepID=UPI00200E6B4C|nr:tRNA pseudouridine(55) synthase TruB [Apilactobacillus xinyiensis]MCL0311625.1 tRNA pseudouridine(55) synthase TruB [Apilactobacillus xinyiensis]